MSEKEAMLLDIQGCEYSLIDPEITKAAQSHRHLGQGNDILCHDLH